MDQFPRDRVFIGHGINRNRTNAWARRSSSRSPRSPPLEFQPSLYSILSNSPRKRIRFGPNMERRQERTRIWPVCVQIRLPGENGAGISLGIWRSTNKPILLLLEMKRSMDSYEALFTYHLIVRNTTWTQHSRP
jgi:hypothetical protein